MTHTENDNRLKIALLVVLAIVVSVVVLVAFANPAHAQTSVIDSVANLSNETAVKVVIVGALAGLVVAYQGYRQTKETFNGLKFFDGILKACLASIPIAVTTAVTQTQLGAFEYVLVFFASMGIAVTYKGIRTPAQTQKSG